MTNPNREIFISYAHGDESEEHAKRLLKLLQEKGREVVIDKKDLGYKGNIEDFEKRIGRGDFIVTIISDKYLRSEHCMFEMVSIERRDEVYDRIFPIVLPDAHSIYSRSGRLNYQKFWKGERESYKKELDETGVDTGMQSSIEDLNKLDQIRLIAGKITAMLAKMYTLEPEQHQRKNYADLLAAIEERMAGEEDFAATPANKFLTKTPGPPDYFVGREQQLQTIHQKLSDHAPLLQDVVSEKLQPNAENCGKLVSVLSDIYKGHLTQSWDYIPYGQTLTHNLTEADFQLGLLNIALADTLENSGNLPQALPVIECVRDIIDQLDEKQNLAVTYSRIGAIHQALGQFDQALEFFELRAQLGKELYAANPKSVDLENGLAVSFYKLAAIYLHDKQSVKAKEYYRKAVQIWQRLHRATGLGTYKSNLETAQQALKNME